MSKNDKQLGIWKLTLAQGIVGAILGVAFITMPGKSVFWLFIFLGITLLIHGVIGIVHGLMSIGKDSNWPIVAFGGVLSVVFGSMILNWPQQTIKVAVLLFGLWAIGSGLVMLVGSLARKAAGVNWAALAIAAVELLFGVFLLAQPVASVKFLMVLNGLFILLISILTIVMSLEVRKLGKA